MSMRFREDGVAFEGATQNARVWSETWVGERLYCPCCGADRVQKFTNNKPAADFFCSACNEEFELKAKKGAPTARVPDGAFKTMMERLEAKNNPSLLLMGYDQAAKSVISLSIVPKHFFVPAIIKERKPLAKTARRAGWIGCDILLDRVPLSGRIEIIRAGEFLPRAQVLEKWRATQFLLDQSTSGRGWLIEVMKCVEQIGKAEFTLAEVYAFESRLHKVYPGNSHVREKIRQQLQVLRDNGFLEFSGRGEYRRSMAS